jgi:ABC-type dipeptide/oligopeptide/nickel transport system permease component
MVYREDVSSLIARWLPTTLYLGLISFVMSTLPGIVAGVVPAVRHGGVMDFLSTMGARGGPIYASGLKPGLLPIQVCFSPFEDFTSFKLMEISCIKEEK